MLITLCWTLSTALSLPAFAHIAKRLHNPNKCFIIKTYPSEPLCTPEPLASSARPQLCSWRWDCPPSKCASGTPTTWGQPGGLGRSALATVSAQYRVTRVSQKTIYLFIRNWGVLIQSFSSQYFVAPWSTRTSYSKVSHQPASGATGHQAQQQPHHSSCMPQVRGTGSFQFSMRTYGYFYVSPSQPVCANITLMFS